MVELCPKLFFCKCPAQFADWFLGYERLAALVFGITSKYWHNPFILYNLTDFFVVDSISSAEKLPECSQIQIQSTQLSHHLHLTSLLKMPRLCFEPRHSGVLNKRILPLRWISCKILWLRELALRTQCGGNSQQPASDGARSLNKTFVCWVN